MSGKHDKSEDEQAAKLLLTGPIVIRGLGRGVKDAFRPGRPSRHRAFVVDEVEEAEPSSARGGRRALPAPVGAEAQPDPVEGAPAVEEPGATSQVEPRAEPEVVAVPVPGDRDEERNEAEAEPQPEPEPERDDEPEPPVEPEAVASHEPEPGPEAEAEPQPEREDEPEPGVEPEPQPVASHDVQTETEPAPEAEPAPEVEAEEVPGLEAVGSDDDGSGSEPAEQAGSVADEPGGSDRGTGEEEPAAGPETPLETVEAGPEAADIDAARDGEDHGSDEDPDSRAWAEVASGSGSTSESEPREDEDDADEGSGTGSELAEETEHVQEDAALPGDDEVDEPLLDAAEPPTASESDVRGDDEPFGDGPSHDDGIADDEASLADDRRDQGDSGALDDDAGRDDDADRADEPAGHDPDDEDEALLRYEGPEDESSTPDLDTDLALARIEAIGAVESGEQPPADGEHVLDEVGGSEDGPAADVPESDDGRPDFAEPGLLAAVDAPGDGDSDAQEGAGATPEFDAEGAAALIESMGALESGEVTRRDAEDVAEAEVPAEREPQQVPESTDDGPAAEDSGSRDIGSAEAWSAGSRQGLADESEPADEEESDPSEPEDADTADGSEAELPELGVERHGRDLDDAEPVGSGSAEEPEEPESDLAALEPADTESSAMEDAEQSGLEQEDLQRERSEESAGSEQGDLEQDDLPSERLDESAAPEQDDREPEESEEPVDEVDAADSVDDATAAHPDDAQAVQGDGAVEAPQIGADADGGHDDTDGSRVEPAREADGDDGLDPREVPASVGGGRTAGLTPDGAITARSSVFASAGAPDDAFFQIDESLVLTTPEDRAFRVIPIEGAEGDAVRSDAAAGAALAERPARPGEVDAFFAAWAAERAGNDFHLGDADAPAPEEAPAAPHAEQPPPRLEDEAAVDSPFATWAAEQAGGDFRAEPDAAEGRTDGQADVPEEETSTDELGAAHEPAASGSMDETDQPGAIGERDGAAVRDDSSATDEPDAPDAPAAPDGSDEAAEHDESDAAEEPGDSSAEDAPAARDERAEPDETVVRDESDGGRAERTGTTAVRASVDPAVADARGALRPGTATGGGSGGRPPRRPSSRPGPSRRPSRGLRERFSGAAVGIAVLAVLAIICAGLITAVVIKTRNDAAIAAREAADYTPPPLVTPTSSPSPTATGPVVAVIGDASSAQAAPGVTPQQRWTGVLETALKGDVVTTASAGMGYAVQGATGQTFAQAAAKVPQDADVVVFFGGAADSAVTTLSLAKAATDAYATVHDRAPDAKVVVVGPALTTGLTQAQVQPIRTTLRNAAAIGKASWVDPVDAAWLPFGARTGPATALTVANEKTIATRMQAVVEKALG